MKILIVDDEQLIRWSLEKHFSSKGHKVFTAESGEEGIRMHSRHNPDIVFLDNKLPKMQGLEVITKIRMKDDEALIVFMTAYGSIETAVKAMKLGAVDYLNKPFTFDEIDLVLEELSAKQSLNKELHLLRRQQKENITFNHIVSRSAVLKEIVDLSMKIASTDTTTILLLGESGTGKDLFARAIHNESSRKDKPFVTINCSSLPETLLESELFGHEQGAFTDAKKLKKGFFEIAEGGTVFLDEIGDINPSMQLKLLSVLENRVVRRLGGTVDIPVEIRIIAATNRDLASTVASRAFREDLYYRLKVFQITLPPLREHKEDIPALVEHFLSQFNTQFGKKINGTTPEVLEMLQIYDWPGNIRELRNVMERAIILETGTILEKESLPAEINRVSEDRIDTSGNMAGNGVDSPANYDNENASLYEVEKQMLIRALEKTNYNQTRASKLLGISRDTLRYRMKKYSLH